MLASTLCHITDHSDYSLPEPLLSFQPGSTSTTTLCTVVVIAGDDIEEVDETVVVRIVPVEPDVTLDGVDKMLTITILNDDGKLLSSLQGLVRMMQWIGNIIVTAIAYTFTYK